VCPVKQEIAKEGVLPFSKFFARNTSIFSRNRGQENRIDATPIGALLLHWVFAVLLILGSYMETPNAAYKMFVNFYSFTIDALFGFCVGLGLLALRINSKRTHWSKKSFRGKWSSICAATIFAIANLFPLVASWFPPNGGTFRSLIPWWVTGTVGMSLLGLGFIYWLVLCIFLPHIWNRTLEVERESIYHNEYGYPVVWHEIVSFGWHIR
jgi:amino acid transporter